MLGSFELQLCDIQGRLFELSGKHGIDSAWFIRAFMTGETAAHFDLPYDRSQWMGEEYLFEEILDKAGVHPVGAPLAKDSPRSPYSQDELFWIGYTYRYWHFATGESSREIYRQADAEHMRDIYPGYHTLDCGQAIERIKELAAL